MFRYLFLQPRNLWRTLGFFQKVQFILVLFIVYVYLITRLNDLLSGWLTDGQTTSSGLASLTGHLFIFSILVSTPFIFIFLVPRQKNLPVFYGKPLSYKFLLQMLAYIYNKYQILNLLLFLPVWIALMLSDVFAGLAMLLLLLIYYVFAFLIFFLLYAMIESRPAYLAVSFLIISGHSLLYALFYRIIGAAWIFDGILLIVMAGISIMILKKRSPTELEVLYPPTIHIFNRKQSGRLDFSSIPRFLPKVTQVLFNKEFLGLWRNPAYRRLKAITFLGAVLVLTAMAAGQVEYREMWMTVALGLIIWLHYSSFFNEKYISAEPGWFFNTMPFRFYQVWFSKFLVEFIFVLVLIITFWLFLLLSNYGAAAQLHLLGLVLLFALIILATMLNFKILFYNDPRLAGYAYHFTVVFLVIMSLNYRLVGPLISIFLLLFYFYKSYKYFNS